MNCVNIDDFWYGGMCMNVLEELIQIQEKFVKKSFEMAVKGEDTNIIRYSSHSLEEMDNDNIEENFLEECMCHSELISSHWEQPFASYKCVFLCESKGFPPFHVVCLIDEKILIKTAYIVDQTKFRNNRVRIRK